VVMGLGLESRLMSRGKMSVQPVKLIDTGS
jgi:hypothetical protein